MNLIIELIKKYGIKKVLERMAEYLATCEDARDRELSHDLRDAVRKYDRSK